MTHDLIEINHGPTIPGLSFRHFRGPSDFPQMAAAIAASADADKVALPSLSVSAAHGADAAWRTR